MRKSVFFLLHVMAYWEEGKLNLIRSHIHLCSGTYFPLVNKGRIKGQTDPRPARGAIAGQRWVVKQIGVLV